MSKTDGLRLAVKYSSAGIELSIIIALCIFGGFRLDKILDMIPLFTVIGAVFGMCLGFFRLFRMFSVEDKRNNDSEKR